MHSTSRYNPQTDTWDTSMPSMPEGVNHAASGTDGERFFIFGGRKGGNVVGPGFDYTQIYDPATGTWRSSTTDPTLPPLPVGRGGTGKALYADGVFMVFGGETDQPASSPIEGLASGWVFERIDLFLVDSEEWVLSQQVLQTPRHGIFPVLLDDGTIIIAGGGT